MDMMPQFHRFCNILQPPKAVHHGDDSFSSSDPKIEFDWSKLFKPIIEDIEQGRNTRDDPRTRRKDTGSVDSGDSVSVSIDFLFNPQKKFSSREHPYRESVEPFHMKSLFDRQSCNTVLAMHGFKATNKICDSLQGIVGILEVITLSVSETDSIVSLDGLCF